MKYRGFIIRKHHKFKHVLRFEWWLDGQTNQDKIISGTGLTIEDCEKQIDKAIKG